MIENFYLNKYKILEKSYENFLKILSKNSDSNQLKIGCELEFFLLDKNKNKILEDKIIDEFCKTIQGKREQGEGQIEIITNFTDDLLNLANKIENIKNKIHYFANQINCLACFDGKPFEDDCGSALQFNISLHDPKNYNIFDDNLIEHCANGLLDSSHFMMLILAPKLQDYRRFDLDLNRKLFQLKKYTAPVNLSFGGDNRSCAIRVCKSTESPNSKRLEYRIASAEADIYLALSAILIALEFGLTQRKSNYSTIYGNAFDDIYQLEKILKNIDEAQKYFYQNDNFIAKKILEFL
jgi:glutamine synthetase